MRRGTSTIRIAIFGSPSFPSLHVIHRLVHALPIGTTVVVGDAGWVALAAKDAAQARGLEVEVRTPKWTEDGPRARLVMYDETILTTDQTLAFWDLDSQNIKTIVRRARGAAKVVTVIAPDGNDVTDQIGGVLRVRADHLERLRRGRELGRLFCAAVAERMRTTGLGP